MKEKLNLKGAQHLATIHPEVVRTSIFALAIPYVLFLHMDDLTRGLNLRAISRLMTELGQTNPYGKSIQGDPSPTARRKMCVYIYIHLFFNSHLSAA